MKLGTLKDSSHRSSRVASFERWLVASPEVSRQLGPVTTPGDLEGALFVALSVLDQPASWSFTGPRGRRVRVTFRTVVACDSVVATRRATLADAGCAVLTDFSVAEDVAAGRLVRILPGWFLPDGGIHVVFPARARQPRKVQAFLATFRQSLAADARRPKAAQSRPSSA